MEIIIDGKKCEAQYGEYVLNVARRNGIQIPALCHYDALPGQATCRLCIVEVEEGGRKKVVTSCVFPVTGEMEVFTNSEKIQRMRKNIIRLLSARAPNNEFIKKLRQEYGLLPETRFSGDDKENCILCGLCVRACDETGISAISTVNRGIEKKVSTPFDEASEACIGCGACAFVCPTGAIKMLDENGIRHLWNKDFELVRCEKCGEYFATREHIEYMKKKYGEDKCYSFCEKCRKRTAGEKMAASYRK